MLWVPADFQLIDSSPGPCGHCLNQGSTLRCPLVVNLHASHRPIDHQGSLLTIILKIPIYLDVADKSDEFWTKIIEIQNNLFCPVPDEVGESMESIQWI